MSPHRPRRWAIAIENFGADLVDRVVCFYCGGRLCLFICVEAVVVNVAVCCSHSITADFGCGCGCACVRVGVDVTVLVSDGGDACRRSGYRS